MSGASIRISGLARSFGARAVLHDVTFEIAAGQFVSLIGPSGAGKSTLLRLIAGLDKPSSGSIVKSKADGAVPDTRIMFQEDRLLPWRSVLRNVTLGLRNRDVEAHKMLEAVGLIGRDTDWPAQLSGGQRQRVALARALVHEPDLLLLDEPFGALDAITRSAMQLLLEKLLVAHPRTVVLVTHDVEEALLLSDRVLLLKDGGIAQDITIDFPRPRHRGAPALAALKEQLIDGLIAAEPA